MVPKNHAPLPLQSRKPVKCLKVQTQEVAGLELEEEAGAGGRGSGWVQGSSFPEQAKAKGV